MRIADNNYSDDHLRYISVPKPRNTLSQNEIVLSDNPSSPTFSVFACNNPTRSLTEAADKANEAAQRNFSRLNMEMAIRRPIFDYHQIPDLDLAVDIPQLTAGGTFIPDLRNESLNCLEID